MLGRNTCAPHYVGDEVIRLRSELPEILVFMDLRQQYNAAVDELQNPATSKRRSLRSGQQVDAVENEASPPAVQNDGYNSRGGSPPSPPGRDDVNDGRNGKSSSSSSDDASDSEEKGQAPPLRHSENHSSSSPEADLGPIEPRPESVLFPAHLIPAQITRSTQVRSRRRKPPSPTVAQGRTYAEYDRFQEEASQHPSQPEPRRSTRIAVLRSSATKSPSTEAPAGTRSSATTSQAPRSFTTRTPATVIPETTPSSFTPLNMLKGAPASLDSPLKHEPTKTSSIWESIISKTAWATNTEPVHKNTSGTSLETKSVHDSSPSAAKSAPSSEPGSGVVVPKVHVFPSTPKPSAQPGQSALPQHDVSRSRATASPGPVPKKGYWESLIDKKKGTTKDFPRPEKNTTGSMAPARKSGLGNSILGKKKIGAVTDSSKADQRTKASPAPARKPGLGNNMLERKREKATTESSSTIRSTKAPSAPPSRSGLGNNMLERKKPPSSQQNAPPPLPPSSQQSTCLQAAMDNSVPCPNCTFRNAPLVLTCGACDASFTRVSSVARRGRPRAKKTADYIMFDDFDE
jgi:hypothetical protein